LKYPLTNDLAGAFLPARPWLHCDCLWRRTALLPPARSTRTPGI